MTCTRDGTKKVLNTIKLLLESCHRPRGIKLTVSFKRSFERF